MAIMRGKRIGVAVCTIALLGVPASGLADGGDGGGGYDSSFETNPRNSPHRNAGPNDPRTYRNPAQEQAEFGYANLNEAAFLLFFDKTTRVNFLTGRTQSGKVTFLQAPLVPSDNDYVETPAGKWAHDLLFDYFVAKAAEERREEEKQQALEAGKRAASRARADVSVPAKVEPENDYIGTSVSFRRSLSLDLKLTASYRTWADDRDLDVNQIRYDSPMLLPFTRPWGEATDAGGSDEADRNAANTTGDDDFRPDSQTRDDTGEGNLLFSVDIKQLLFGGGMTQIDPPTPGLLEDGDPDWDSYFQMSLDAGWGALDVGKGSLSSGYYFTATPAETQIEPGSLFDNFSYDLNFKTGDAQSVPLRKAWRALDETAPNELRYDPSAFRLQVRYKY